MTKQRNKNGNDELREEGAASTVVESKRNAEIQIGLWGTVGSGKTTYLAMLYQDILERDGFRIEECDGVSEEFISEVYEKITWEGDFPKRTTPVPTAIKTYSFRIYRDTESTEEDPVKSAVLTVMDAGGEWYRSPKKMLEEYSETYAEDPDKVDPITNLANSDGIICLIDVIIALGHRMTLEGEAPEENPTDREFFRDLRSLFIQLKRRGETELGYVKPHIAFCLSKVDFTPAWPYRDEPRELVEQFLPNRVRKVIDNFCREDKMEWFGVSSVGVSEDENGEETSVVEKNNSIRNPNNLSPYNLFEPIGWLVYKVSGDKRWLVK